MLLDGKKIKYEILDEIKNKVSELSVKPKLVVIQVGDDEASNVYIKQKGNMCSYVGYDFEHIKLASDVNTDFIVNKINDLNNDKMVSGILVQLPLPLGIDTDKVLNTIDPSKDVDGLSDINIGKLCHGKDTLYACTPYGIMTLLERYNIDVSGKHVVIVGRSNLVGKPISMMLLNRDATVTVCHSKTLGLENYTKNADILIVAVGKPKFITKEMISRDSVVIDVGISRSDIGLCGDVDYENVKDIVSYITPVPGGVGPMTVSMLSMNVLKAFEMQNGKGY